MDFDYYLGMGCNGQCTCDCEGERGREGKRGLTERGARRRLLKMYAMFNVQSKAIICD